MFVLFNIFLFCGNMNYQTLLHATVLHFLNSNVITWFTHPLASKRNCKIPNVTKLLLEKQFKAPYSDTWWPVLQLSRATWLTKQHIDPKVH